MAVAIDGFSSNLRVHKILGDKDITISLYLLAQFLCFSSYLLSVEISPKMWGYYNNANII